MLSSLLALPGVLVKDVTELVPPGFRDQNRVLEVPLHLRDGDVTPLGVLLAREEEVLVLDLDVAGLEAGIRSGHSNNFSVGFSQSRTIVEKFCKHTFLCLRQLFMTVS